MLVAHEASLVQCCCATMAADRKESYEIKIACLAVSSGYNPGYEVGLWLYFDTAAETTGSSCLIVGRVDFKYVCLDVTSVG